MSHTRSSGSLTNNSFSLTRHYCVPEPIDSAYLLLLIAVLQDDCNYLHLRVRETVLRGVNNLPKITHQVSGKTDSLVPLGSRMQTCHTFDAPPLGQRAREVFPGCAYSPHPQDICAQDPSPLGRCQEIRTNWGHWPLF